MLTSGGYDLQFAIQVVEEPVSREHDEFVLSCDLGERAHKLNCVDACSGHLLRDGGAIDGDAHEGMFG